MNTCIDSVIHVSITSRNVGNSLFRTPKCHLLCLGGPTSNAVSFSISNIPLSISQFSTDSVVTIDFELKFTKYVNETVARAKQRAAIIHHCFLSRNVNNLISAFKTYVRPLLEYATQIWSPYQKYSINAVESVQRAFTKRLPGLADLSYTERLVNLNLQSLKHRRLISDLSMCFTASILFMVSLPCKLPTFLRFQPHPPHAVRSLIQISCPSVQK